MGRGTMANEMIEKCTYNIFPRHLPQAELKNLYIYLINKRLYSYMPSTQSLSIINSCVLIGHLNLEHFHSGTHRMVRILS